MSVWDNDMLKVDETSPWIKNDYFATKRVLKWTDLSRREQREGTPEEFKTPDGMELMFTFIDPLTNQEKYYTTRSAKGALPAAMKAAGIEIGDSFEAIKEGSGITMTFTVNKVREDGTVEVKEDKPF